MNMKILCATTLALASWSMIAVAQVTTGGSQTAGSGTSAATSPNPNTTNNTNTSTTSAPANTSDQQGASNQTAARPAENMTTPLSPIDKNFIDMAARSNDYEIMEGKLAEQKGDAQVQKVGQRLVKDHMKANDTLRMDAQALSYPIPTNMTIPQQDQYNRLKNESQSSFDKQYLRDQRRAHIAAIKMYKNEVEHGKNPRVTGYAKDTLPMLHEHLKIIKSAQSGKND